MIVMLDAHVLLWWWADDPRLGQPARRSIADPANAMVVSAGTIWEIAVKRAMDQFRWFTGNWRVNAELPVPASFDAASRTVRAEDVSTQMPCGPDVERHVTGIRAFETAGFTHIALVQVGGDTQEQFISWAAQELLPVLRSS